MENLHNVLLGSNEYDRISNFNIGENILDRCGSEVLSWHRRYRARGLKSKFGRIYSITLRKKADHCLGKRKYYTRDGRAVRSFFREFAKEPKELFYSAKSNISNDKSLGGLYMYSKFHKYKNAYGFGFYRKAHEYIRSNNIYGLDNLIIDADKQFVGGMFDVTNWEDD